MSELDEQFQQAKAAALELAKPTDNDTLLQLYALYKQGSQGDAQGDKPGFFDFVGTAKYQAWDALRGMPSDEAQRRYIDQVKVLRG